MITWYIEEKEADYVLNVLAQRPFAEVNQLINKLVQQANAPKMAEMDAFTERLGDDLVAMADTDGPKMDRHP